MKKFTKKGIIILVVITLAISSAAAISRTTGSGAALGAASFVIVPVQSGCAYVVRHTKGLFVNIKNSKKNAAENKKLKKEIAKLKDEIRMVDGYKTENEKLHTLLEFADSRKELNLKAANIIGRSSGGTVQIITIDKGTRDGVKKGSAAVAAEGLVGVVVEAGKNFSKIRTIFDEESAVAAICPRSGDMGIVKGREEGTSDGRIVMNYVDKDAKIVVGDVLETSGTGGIFPRGILIGKVTDIKNDDRGLTLSVGIAAGTNPDKLDTVLVEKQD